MPAGSIEYVPSMNDVLNGSDALVLVTEWKQFRAPDFSLIKSKLSSPVIFDGRNIYEPIAMKELGFDYYCIGRTVS